MRSWRDIFAFVIIATAIVVVAGFFAYFAMGDITQTLARATDPSLIGLPTDWQLNFHRANTVLQSELVQLFASFPPARWFIRQRLRSAWTASGVNYTMPA